MPPGGWNVPSYQHMDVSLLTKQKLREHPLGTLWSLEHVGAIVLDDVRGEELTSSRSVISWRIPLAAHLVTWGFPALQLENTSPGMLARGYF